MSHKNVICTVDAPSNPFGEFANSFRISQDGSEVLLDFCVYSELEKIARVVSRVRVSLEFLPAIHQKIGASLSVGEGSLILLMPTNDFPH